jgi:urease accessory protein
MNKGRKLLDYVQMLDSSLTVGEFTHSLAFEEQIAKGMIHNCGEFESFMKDHLQTMILRTDGWAIKEIYVAAEGNDLQKVAFIDKVIQNRKSNMNDEYTPQKDGKRLLKLARALYPWMDFDDFESALYEYRAFGCLTTVHAWINHQLEVDCDQAVQGYMFYVVSSCIQRASGVMHISSEEEDLLIQTLLISLKQEWNTLKNHSPEVLQYSTTA